MILPWTRVIMIESVTACRFRILFATRKNLQKLDSESQLDWKINELNRFPFSMKQMELKLFKTNYGKEDFHFENDTDWWIQFFNTDSLIIPICSDCVCHLQLKRTSDSLSYWKRIHSFVRGRGKKSAFIKL